MFPNQRANDTALGLVTLVQHDTSDNMSQGLLDYGIHFSNVYNDAPSCNVTHIQMI